MTIASLFIFATALALAAGSPGPSIAALVARVLARGHREVLPFLAAMWLGEALWLTLAVAGLTTLAQSFAGVFVAIKWFGVAYLLFLAWKMWHAPQAGEDEALPQASSGLRMFLTGLAVTLGNPKIMLFYVALLPSIIDLNTVGLIGWAELTITMLLVLALVDLGWMLAAARARLFLKSPRALKIANRASAGLMAGAAAAIAARS